MGKGLLESGWLKGEWTEEKQLMERGNCSWFPVSEWHGPEDSPGKEERAAFVNTRGCYSSGLSCFPIMLFFFGKR